MGRELILYYMAPFLFLSPWCHSTGAHRYDSFLDAALTGVAFADC